ncbi:RNA polymerase sigma-70 factor, ECF subfamily [Saccharicrinis carchari]|uniref:RNA polymerase sigma-70 factor, ECF subfamily n=1 Tax=Saccharicrinis carchari TaxID=1168039 RepID=A0A521C0F6_SACCC|nr:RNA polymerase sigma-70 factor [Saccharicrinis carchari]SMO52210.1 RNA polymerase sigma-70 factor, ECF subfamily [Saccharicrinis carchari]
MKQFTKKTSTNGSDRHFRNVFDTYFAELCHFAYSFTLDFDLSQDIVQETFIKYWKAKDNFLENGTTRAWLYKTTRNSCLDHLKSKRTKTSCRVEALELLTMEISPELGSMEIEEIKAIIASVLRDMPELSSQIFKMNRYEDLTYPEIAQKVNLSVKSVEYHMSKVLAKLRVGLKEYYFLVFFV